jgi:hypothetical protein
MTDKNDTCKNCSAGFIFYDLKSGGACCNRTSTPYLFFLTTKTEFLCLAECPLGYFAN